MHTLEQLRSGQLRGTRRLDLSAGLAALPPEVFELADTLEVLNLSGNALSELPDDLPRLHRLKVLFCSDNQFTRVPEVVGACPSLRMVGFKANQVSELPAAALPPHLRWLILTDNQLATLPDALGERPLEKMALAGNRLHALPESLASCQSLALLRISANAFEHLPSWLLQLPRLAWLAAGGNPWNVAREAAVLRSGPRLSVPWSALHVGELLGQGASGHIHAAQWPAGPAPLQQLALKVFKGQVTSDGWPHSEWAASLGVGEHPHLIAACASLDGHPQGAEALLMPRIGPDFKVLAAPPSLDSCTRDVYDPSLRLMPEVLQRMVLGTASAAAHLHARGIVHGDLYAHNLLWHPEGQVWLGDFGAATLLPEGLDAAQRGALERLEVLAFAHLLDELLQHCPEAPEAWRLLQQRCAKLCPTERPGFEEILASLD